MNCFILSIGINTLLWDWKVANIIFSELPKPMQMGKDHEVIPNTIIKQSILKPHPSPSP